MYPYDSYYSQEPFSVSEAYENVPNPYEVNDYYLTEDPYRPQNQLQQLQQNVPGQTQPFPPFGPPTGGQQQPPFGPPSGGQQQPPFGPPSGGQQHTPPFGPPSGGQQHTPPFGPPSGGQQHTPPFGPPSGGQQHTPPFGPPPGGQQHLPPHHDGPPTAPPPSYVPQLSQASVTAIHAPSMRRCLYRNTYVWLMNGRRFWFYPTYVGRTSVAGYRWSERRNRWAYFGIDASEIRSFQCF